MEAGKVFQVKREVYRFTSLVLSGFVLYYNLDAYSAGQVIDQFFYGEAIKTEAAHHLRSYFASGEERKHITGSVLPLTEPKALHSDNKGTVSKLRSVFNKTDPNRSRSQ